MPVCSWTPAFLGTRCSAAFKRPCSFSLAPLERSRLLISPSRTLAIWSSARAESKCSFPPTAFLSTPWQSSRIKTSALRPLAVWFSGNLSQCKFLRASTLLRVLGKSRGHPEGLVVGLTYLLSEAVESHLRTKSGNVIPGCAC